MFVFLFTFLLSLTFLYTAHASSGGIVLDGYFDDWVDKPSAKLKYGWQNDDQYSTVKWYSDDQNLYLYIKMAEVGYSHLSTNIIFYHVDGGRSSQFQLTPDYPVNGRASVYEYSLDYRPFTTDGYVVRGGSSDGIIGDQVEFRVPLDLFYKNNNKIANVKLEFPNLGDQFIIFHAASTFPYVGVAVCIFISSAAAFIYNRRKHAL